LKRNIKKISTAASGNQFEQEKVNRAIKTIDRSVVQALMKGLKEKVRKFGRGEKI
jgi:hypothetical protein